MSTSENITWYPGHMLKAKKELAAILKQVDILLELRDARIPMSSVNQDFEVMLRQKKRILLFNKAGLAEAKETQRWQSFFLEQTIPHLFIDVLQNQGLNKILPQARNMMKEKWETFKKKGMRHPPLRLGVVGIPNVGKSSLINRIAKRNAAQTGPLPGVTKQQAWITLSNDVELIDTPGILWPNLENQEVALRLAVTGAIKDSVVGEDRMADYLVGQARLKALTAFNAYYQIDFPPEVGNLQVIEAIAQKRGCLKAKGEVDLHRISEHILKDFREGKIGRITFDSFDDYKKA